MNKLKLGKTEVLVLRYLKKYNNKKYKYPYNKYVKIIEITKDLKFSYDYIRDILIKLNNKGLVERFDKSYKFTVEVLGLKKNEVVWKLSGRGHKVLEGLDEKIMFEILEKIEKEPNRTLQYYKKHFKNNKPFYDMFSRLRDEDYIRSISRGYKTPIYYAVKTKN